MIEEIISFDLYGKTAHFRKYYSSSTALSYTLPPKTTILGLIGAIIGLPRDSYYDEFDDWYVSVQIISPVRKIFQKMNFLKVEDTKIGIEKTNSHVTGELQRTQVSFEVVAPIDLRKGVVKYRIYIGVSDTSDERYMKLKKFLSNDYNTFGISLGAANMLGFVENYCSKCEFQSINLGNMVDIHSWAQTKMIQLQTSSKNFEVEQDTIPLKFESETKDNIVIRRASIVKELIYPTTLNGMPVKILNNECFYKIQNETFYNIALL